MTPPPMWPSALSGVLSYRNREHVCCGTLAHFCTIEPLRRTARTTRLLLRILGGHPPLVVDQELHLCPNSTPVAPAVGLVASLVDFDSRPSWLSRSFLRGYHMLSAKALWVSLEGACAITCCVATLQCTEPHCLVVEWGTALRTAASLPCEF